MLGKTLSEHRVRVGQEWRRLGSDENYLRHERLIHERGYVITNSNQGTLILCDIYKVVSVGSGMQLSGTEVVPVSAKDLPEIELSE